MITGVGTARREILVRVPVLDRAGLEHWFDAVVDTGFNGSLSLPTRAVVGLGLPWHSRGRAILANASAEEFDVHVARVVWDGTPRHVLVPAINASPLLGMRMLVGFDLRARVIVGGRVEIEAIP